MGTSSSTIHIGLGVAALVQCWTGFGWFQSILKVLLAKSEVGMMEFNTQGVITPSLIPVSFENGELTCDVSQLATGLWFLNLKGLEKNVVLKLAIVR